MILHVPNRRDPRWRDAAWRRDTFHQLVADHGVTRAALPALCDITPNTAEQWFLKAHTARPPGPDKLHVLLLLAQAGMLK
jgi:hypothetical protein